MPQYVYRCSQGHMRSLVHGMREDPKVICRCGMNMHRVPQVTSINWNGNRAVITNDVVRQMIKDAPRKRDEFAAQKEAHVKKTAKERRRLQATDPTYGSVVKK